MAEINPGLAALLAQLKVATLASTTTINMDASVAGTFLVSPLSNNFTLANPTNLIAGQGLTLITVQDGIGNRLISGWGNLFLWTGKTPPILSTAPGSIDAIFSLFVGGFLLSSWQTNYG